MSVRVVNFGCRLNTYEGEVIRAQATEAGVENAIIFNSCAVTAEAERQLRQSIRKTRKSDPNARIIVTGCAAQIHPEEYANMAEVDHVLGNANKLEASSYRLLAERGERAVVNDIMAVHETASHLVSAFEGRARAFVQIQNGCDHRCTFCIIPYGRGPSRSVAVGEVVTQVRTLVESGYKEVVLTGVDLTDYGKDLPGTPSLGALVKRVLKLVPELPRLRLSSIDAAEVDTDLLDVLAQEPRLMPHLHLSVQAGDDMVLKRMKRRHLRQDIVDFCVQVRNIRPDIVFGADIIAGFPTETDEMFENTHALVDDAGLTWLHVFPYSARTGTPAARMPQVPMTVRKQRAAILRAAGDKQVAALLASRIGKQESILMESAHIGRTPQFAELYMANAQVAGEVLDVRVQAVNAAQLQGAWPYELA